MMRWWARNMETLVLAVSLAIISSLVWWWAIFTSRLIGEHALIDPAQARRFALMLHGESAVFAFALVTSVVVLFMIARARRNAQLRMERLLQFTSHELKTPIAGVRALLQSLALGSIPEDAKREFLGQGIAECDRLEHLAETILAYQRSVATGARQPARAEVLLEEVLAHRKKTMPDEQLELAGPPPAATVWADRDAFRVIVENLLDNAKKYGAGKARVKAHAGHNHWSLEISDGGLGFPPGDAELLFDPFAPRPRNGVTHGSGLGLSISRQLARQMGGDLRARSEGPGKGSTFTLTLHTAPEQEAKGA
jgi:two-component system phosphate regulon sensor histidine kinase PhoR